MDPNRALAGFVRLLQGLIRRHSGSILVAFVLVVSGAGYFASQVQIDTSIENLLLRGDPDRAANRELKTEFSNDEVTLIAFDLGAPFDEADLRKLASISERIADMPGVEEVIDLSNVEDVRGDDRQLDASPLLDLQKLNGNIGELRERTRGHRLYRSSLVSDDLSVLSQVIIPSSDLDTAESHALFWDIKAFMEETAPPWRVYLSGFAPTEAIGTAAIRQDLAILTAAAFLCILLVLYIALQRKTVLLLLSALVLWTELITLGWFGLTGTPIAVVTSAVPTIVLATSSTYAIYLFGLLQRVSNAPEPGVAVLETVTRPALLSGLSTAIGFLALRVLQVQMIGDLGVALAIGISAAVIGTLLLLPALIHVIGIRISPTRLQSTERWSLWGLALARRPWIPIGAAIALLALALPGIGRISVDTNLQQDFALDHPLRVATDFFDQRVSGPFVINFVIRSGEADGVLQPAVLRFAENLVQEVESTPGVTRTSSILDYFFLIDAALRPGKKPEAVPATPELAAQYMLLYDSSGDPDDYRHYINHDRSALNILARTNTGSKGYLRIREQVRQLAASMPDLQVQTLGSMFLFYKAMDPIALGVTKGLLAAMGLIILIFAILLGSPRLALIAAIPNAIPILCFAGALGWFGIPLSIGTSIVGSIALGLAVDDTAHVIGHLKAGHSLEETYRAVGRPLILTTLALGLGFSTMMLSQFATVFMLGVATALTLVLALFCDLLLLPALLRVGGYVPER